MQLAHSNPIPTTLLTNINIAPATLQNILVMSCIAHLAAEASSRRTVRDAFKAPRMLTLMVLLQVVQNKVYAALALQQRGVGIGISLDDFFGALNEAVFVGEGADAVFPSCTAEVAEFGFAVAPVGR